MSRQMFCSFSRRSLSLGLATTALSGLAAVSLYSPTAQACGGTFCDAGPTSMPVDQSGENIIFVMEPGAVEAHIQIQYDPDTSAETFAWVIPVMSLPEFSVGSELFFDAVLNATVPTYGLSTQFDSCGDTSSGFSTFGSSDGGSGEASTGTGGGDEGGGPTVVHQETVGAFDISVLQGGDIDEVMAWLETNGYEQDPAAMPILGEYLDEDFLFVAMKLTTDAANGVDTVHPITLRMQEEEACVPLRLTAIAASIDMDVRTFFFAQDRVVPTNYRHVEVNPLKIDWLNLGNNYKEVVTLAVDADGADGNAFVTEYAGRNANIWTGAFSSPQWDTFAESALTLTDSPLGIYEMLENNNLFWCDAEFQETCFAQHPLIESLLAQYVPAPEGLPAADFYSCMSCYEALIDLNAWDPAAFAVDFELRVTGPGLRAKEIVEDFPYLTRMYTTISGNEMNQDPVFAQNPDLDDVAAGRFATQTIHCDGDATMLLPDGREVKMPDSNVWPEIFPDEMPWEETVARGTVTGALMTEVTRSEEINDLLSRWNEGNKGSSASGSDGGAGGAGACACDAGERGPGGAAGMLLSLFGLLGLRARRRRS